MDLYSCGYIKVKSVLLYKYVNVNATQKQQRRTSDLKFSKLID